MTILSPLIQLVHGLSLVMPTLRPPCCPGTVYRPSGSSPLGRIATPEDVVAVMHFLLQPASNYVTGAWIPVDGGTSAAFSGPAATVDR